MLPHLYWTFSISSRYTIPILWDKKLKTIVNNESSEIIRILNTAFNELLPPEKAALDLYPEKLRAEIDGINEWVYDRINSKFIHIHLYALAWSSDRCA